MNTVYILMGKYFTTNAAYVLGVYSSAEVAETDKQRRLGLFRDMEILEYKVRTGNNEGGENSD